MELRRSATRMDAVEALGLREPPPPITRLHGFSGAPPFPHKPRDQKPRIYECKRRRRSSTARCHGPLFPSWQEGQKTFSILYPRRGKAALKEPRDSQMHDAAPPRIGGREFER